MPILQNICAESYRERAECYSELTEYFVTEEHWFYAFTATCNKSSTRCAQCSKKVWFDN